MNKNDTVALMAATIYAAGASDQPISDADVTTYGRVAAQAWALYDAVEREAAQRHSKR